MPRAEEDNLLAEVSGCLAVSDGYQREVLARLATALAAAAREREDLHSILRNAANVSHQHTVTIQEAEPPLMFVVSVQDLRKDF